MLFSFSCNLSVEEPRPLDLWSFTRSAWRAVFLRCRLRFSRPSGFLANWQELRLQSSPFGKAVGGTVCTGRPRQHWRSPPGARLALRRFAGCLDEEMLFTCHSATQKCGSWGNCRLSCWLLCFVSFQDNTLVPYHLLKVIIAL